MPYCAALSFSRMKFTSSIAILSESGGSSSRICRACRHVSQSSVCVKNSSRTGAVISIERFAELFLIGWGEQRHLTRLSALGRAGRTRCGTRSTAERPRPLARGEDHARRTDRLALALSGRSPSPEPQLYLNRSSNAWRAAAGAGRALLRRAGLTLDRRARREQRAVVARILRRDARGQLRRSACTPSARWCRTTRTARSCAGRRRTSDSGCRRRPAATAGCRSARSGRPRAPPSGSASSVRRRPAADVRARGPASADAAPPAPSGHAACSRPDSRVVGTFDLTS